MSQTARAILRVEHVTKEFGGLVALKDVSLQVNEGMMLGLIGPNGAGKTTLFNVISGFYAPNSGRILLDGEEITGLPPHTIARRGIARTFQITRPLNSLTVEEAVKLAAWVKPRDPKELESTVEQSIRIVGLEDIRGKRCKDLNLVQNRLAELARALATKPRLLLLDEPAAGLVPSEIEHLIKLIRNLNKDKGLSLIVVEHVLGFAMNLCHRIVVIDYGGKIAEGSPAEVTSNKAVIEAYLGKGGVVDAAA